MKILIISSKFPNQVEISKGTFVYEQVLELSSKNEIKVVSAIPIYPKIQYFNKFLKYLKIPREYNEMGINVYYPRIFSIPKNIFSKLTAFQSYNAVWEVVRRIHKEWNFDLIHAHFSYLDGWIAYRISQKLNIPYLITEHNGSFIKNFNKSERKDKITVALKNAIKVISVSETLKRNILACVKVPQIEIIPNGINTNNFFIKDKGSRSKSLQLISVGNMVNLKGYDILLKAFQISLNKGANIRLWLIGDGPEKKKLEKLANDYCISGHVEFLGIQSNKIVSEYLKKSDVFISSSYVESFGVAILEALAVGLPVIVTRSGGPENFINEKLGYIVEKGNALEIHKAIMKIIDSYQFFDPEYISSYTKENFNIEKIANKIEVLYQEIFRK